MNKEVVLFLTDKINQNIIERFNKLKTDIEDFCDILVLYHQHENTEIPQELLKYNHFIFTDDDIFNKLGYKYLNQKSFIPNSHFAFFYFMKNYSKKYSYYWQIENDVMFNGDWKYFISNIPYEYDFVGSYIELKKPNSSRWFWYERFYDINNNRVDDKFTLLKSFVPVFRLSYDACLCLDSFYMKGYSGHYELTFPTVLYNNKLKIGDIGKGEFSIPNLIEHFYTSKGTTNEETQRVYGSSFRFRPNIEEDEIVYKNKLYHPHKL